MGLELQGCRVFLEFLDLDSHSKYGPGSRFLNYTSVMEKGTFEKKKFFLDIFGLRKSYGSLFTV